MVGKPEELHDVNRDGNGRSPLVARFRHKETGEELVYAVNHLRRGSWVSNPTQPRLFWSSHSEHRPRRLCCR